MATKLAKKLGYKANKRKQYRKHKKARLALQNSTVTGPKDEQTPTQAEKISVEHTNQVVPCENKGKKPKPRAKKRNLPIETIGIRERLRVLEKTVVWMADKFEEEAHRQRVFIQKLADRMLLLEARDAKPLVVRKESIL